MAQRHLLQSILEDILESDQAHFQPPPNLQMEYPSIVYNVDNADTKFAGNVPYTVTQRYQVTIISKTPDTDIRDKVAALPMCIFNRWYAANNLHHYVYTLYF